MTINDDDDDDDDDLLITSLMMVSVAVNAVCNKASARGVAVLGATIAGSGKIVCVV